MLNRLGAFIYLAKKKFGWIGTICTVIASIYGGVQFYEKWTDERNAERRMVHISNISSSLLSANTSRGVYCEKIVGEFESTVHPGDTEKTANKYHHILKGYTDCKNELAASDRRLSQFNSSTDNFRDLRTYDTAKELLRRYEKLDKIDFQRSSPSKEGIAQNYKEATSLLNKFNSALNNVEDSIRHYENDKSNKNLASISLAVSNLYKQELGFLLSSLPVTASKFLTKAEDYLNKEQESKTFSTPQRPPSRAHTPEVPGTQPAPNTTPFKNATTYFALTNADIMAEPSPGSRVSGEIQGGSRVSLISEKGRWVEIKDLTSGLRGYIKRELIGELAR